MNTKNSKWSLDERWKTALPGMVLTGFYLLGFAFPNSFWGLHYPSFLPAGIGVLVMGLALALSSWPFWAPSAWSIRDGFPTRPAKLVLALVLTALYGYLFSSLPLASHCYGDAQFIYANLNGEVTQWDSKMLTNLITPGFTDLKTGVGTYYSLVSLVAWAFSVNAVVAAVWVDTAMGMLFVALWLSLTDRFFKLPEAKLAFGMLGLGLPFLQVYFGHYEVYAIPFTLNLAYFYLLLLVFETGKKRTFWGAVVMAYFCMKFQFANLVLAPSLAMAAISVFGGPSTRKRLLTWRGALVMFVVPICLLGSLMYFFVTKSAFGLREFTEDSIGEVVFLPLRAMESPPLDRYNLLSPPHLFDFFNLLFLLSAACIMLIAVAAWLRPAKGAWASPASVTLGTTLGLYLIAFFVFNPLMSMPIDWDLMSIPGTALLAFTVALWSKVDQKRLFLRLCGPILGLSLLGAAGWWVNANPTALSARLESAGLHGFRTYRIGMSSTFEQAWELEADSSKIPLRREAILAELEADAVMGNDVEYAAMILSTGKWYEKQENNLPRAVGYYDRAVAYSPLLPEAVYACVVGHFLLGEFDAAADNLPLLVKLRYPDRRKSLRIAIHTSLEAARYPDAEKYCSQYLKKFPNDAFIRETYELLRKGENLGELKRRFSGG